MPEEQANPQEPHDAEEELDLESQLDAVLSQLQALEPDLLPSPAKPPEPVVAQPVVEDAVEIPQPSGSEEAVVDQKDTQTLEAQETIVDVQSADTPVETEAASAADGPQSIGSQLDDLIAQQIDQEIVQEIGEDPTLDSTNDRVAAPVGAIETPDDPVAASVAAEPGQDENQASLSADQIDTLINQGIEQQIDEALSSTTAETVETEVADVVPDSDVAGGDPNSAEVSAPPSQEQSTASMIDGLLNAQIAQEIDDAQADEAAPDVSATIAPAEEATIAEASSLPTDEDTKDTSDAEPESVDAAVAEAPSLPTDEDTKDTSDAPSTGQQIDDILAQLSGELTDGDTQEASDAEPESSDAVDTTDEEGEGLSVEQIDAMLAQEAEQTVADEFETPTEIQASSGVPADADQDSDSSASSSEGEQHDAGGFTAGAGDVAAEIDDQPENKSQIPQVATIAAKFKKQDMAGHIVVCKRALWRTCFVINRPLEKIPAPARDAVGYFALAHVMIGSVLILGKLVGIV